MKNFYRAVVWLGGAASALFVFASTVSFDAAVSNIFSWPTGLLSTFAGMDTETATLLFLAGLLLFSVVAAMTTRSAFSGGLRASTVRPVIFWWYKDRIPAFRLGQWAALIEGYEYPPIGDDPGQRPWRDTFFFLKRSIENGDFELPDGRRKADRDLLVDRSTIRAFYEKIGERPRALFADGDLQQK